MVQREGDGALRRADGLGNLSVGIVDGRAPANVGRKGLATGERQVVAVRGIFRHRTVHHRTEVIEGLVVGPVPFDGFVLTGIDLIQIGLVADITRLPVVAFVVVVDGRGHIGAAVEVEGGRRSGLRYAVVQQGDDDAGVGRGGFIGLHPFPGHDGGGEAVHLLLAHGHVEDIVHAGEHLSFVQAIGPSVGEVPAVQRIHQMLLAQVIEVVVDGELDLGVIVIVEVGPGHQQGVQDVVIGSVGVVHAELSDSSRRNGGGIETAHGHVEGSGDIDVLHHDVLVSVGELEGIVCLEAFSLPDPEGDLGHGMVEFQVAATEFPERLVKDNAVAPAYVVAVTEVLAGDEVIGLIRCGSTAQRPGDERGVGAGDPFVVIFVGAVHLPDDGVGRSVRNHALIDGFFPIIGGDTGRKHGELGIAGVAVFPEAAELAGELHGVGSRRRRFLCVTDGAGIKSVCVVLFALHDHIQAGAMDQGLGTGSAGHVNLGNGRAFSRDARRHFNGAFPRNRHLVAPAC